jgi:hypothetical protein
VQTSPQKKRKEKHERERAPLFEREGALCCFFCAVLFFVVLREALTRQKKQRGTFILQLSDEAEAELDQGKNRKKKE